MGNVFAAGVFEEGPRGRQAFSAPNWIMADLGVDLARWNRLSLDVMLTAELWTTPAAGYPELLQIGEKKANGRPFLDAQHPHSSPIMGLTLGDTFALGGGRLLMLSFAPRGESTDGPIAFMHRATGTVNPDAPLGHHIGQDAGHISSTVLAASLLVGSTEIEASTFYGLEPDPTRVDLPLGAPDSAALRLDHTFGSFLTASASAAYVTNPEGEPDIPHVVRISASTYTRSDVLGRWRLQTTEVFGGIFGYDRTTFLPSLLGELLLSDDDANQAWSRLEVLQRTPNELGLATAKPNVGQWVGALTLGYTRKIVSVVGLDLSAGGSVSADALPSDYASSYGGAGVFSGKIFIELRGMEMFSAGPGGM